VLGLVLLLAKAIMIVEPRQYHFALFLGGHYKTAMFSFNLSISYLSWMDKTPVELSLKIT
jgi:hypothetical protein